MAGSGKVLFTRQSSGLVREVSVVNALFFNTSAFIGGTLGGAFQIAVLAGVPVVVVGGLTNWSWVAFVVGGMCVLLALIFASLMAWVVVHLPPSSSAFMQTYQGQLEGVFGNAWRIAVGSMIAFWCGSFSNSYVMAKMKVSSVGKHLWMRTIGSTLVGELVDSGLFYLIAFYGIWATGDVIKVAIIQYLFKTGWEVVMTPVTYRVVGFLKRVEDEDYYDTNTKFTPFSLK